MTEGVGMDVRQIMRLREFCEPLGDAVRRHMVAIVRRKDISGFDPAVAVLFLYATLLRSTESGGMTFKENGIWRQMTSTISATIPSNTPSSGQRTQTTAG